MPDDPYEAEMLLLARASSESAQAEDVAARLENSSLPEGNTTAPNFCKVFY